MEVDLGGLDLAGVMTGALQEGDRLQGQYCSKKYLFSKMTQLNSQKTFPS